MMELNQVILQENRYIWNKLQDECPHQGNITYPDDHYPTKQNTIQTQLMFKY